MHIFESTDKDYKIEISNKPSSLFNTNNYYHSICTLVFKNNIGNIIKIIRLTDTDIINLIDNIYSFMEMNNDSMIYYINSNDNTMIDSIIKITLEKTITNTYIQKFYLYNYYDESMIQLLSFDISENIIELIDSIYNEVYDQSIDTNLKYLNPIDIFNNNL